MNYSAGIIPFRVNDNGDMEFFVGHPGGTKKNYWAFLKGGVENDEKWQDTAIREFKEESGVNIEDCDSSMLIPLGSVLQNPRKTTIAYGLHFPNIDESKCFSNIADDGVTVEIDRYRWMTIDELEKVTHPTHMIFYQKLLDLNNEHNKG